MGESYSVSRDDPASTARVFTVQPPCQAMKFVRLKIFGLLCPGPGLFLNAADTLCYENCPLIQSFSDP